MQVIDTLLNRFTMYRVVAFGLLIEIGWGLVASVTGLLDLSTRGITLSLALGLGVGLTASLVLTRLYHAATNTESGVITSLILVLIMPPVTSVTHGLALALAVLLALASKFVLQYRLQQLVNPAAFGAALVGILGLGYASWWVGSPVMAPVTIVLGLLIVRKVRRTEMVTLFVAVSIATSLAIILSRGDSVSTQLMNMLLSSPLIFLASVMLTEPSTLPSTRTFRNDVALIVAVLSSLQVTIFGVSLSAQLALVIGNLFAFVVSRRPKMVLAFTKCTRLTPSIYDYTFTSAVPLAFVAGQYMEWTLPHAKVDSRGNRRSFTIASSPREPELHLALRMASGRRSTFKRALAAMRPGDTLVAGQVSGGFVLPHDKRRPLVWIAGGVGITPFRSMATVSEGRTIDLIYLARSADEFAYRDVFTAVQGLVPHYLTGSTLMVDELTRLVPDYAGRTFFIAGSNAMVTATLRLLRRLDIPRSRIMIDDFSGY